MSATALPFFLHQVVVILPHQYLVKVKMLSMMPIFPEIPKVILKLLFVQQKSKTYEEDIALLEKYSVVMYSAMCNTTDVKTCRILFAKRTSVET